MRYDFDTPIDRRGTGSLKWDVAERELPMWVADMDFRTAPEIREAIEARAAHGVFGYSIIPDEWEDAVIGWWQRRHGFTIRREWLAFSAGVVPSLSSIVRKLTTPNENVLIQTPVYNIFFNSIVNNGRRVLESPLSYDGDTYSIDWARLEADLSDPQTSLMILCNPHNPVGKIWDRETLARIGELCKKHGVTIVSDEIHCDLTDPGIEYVPFLSASETCREIGIACVAPTKCFNIAGIQSSAIIAPDPVLHHKVWRALNTDEVGEPNVFAIPAAIAAFTKGDAWLDELRAYLYENKREVYRFMKDALKDIHVLPCPATYLMWLDCSAVTDDTDALAASIREKTGLYLSAGSQYGGNGKKFLRLNVACPRSTLRDGLERLKKGIEG